MAKAGIDRCKLPLKATGGGEEEMQEANVTEPAANDISVDAAIVFN